MMIIKDDLYEVQTRPTTAAELDASFLRVWIVFLWHLSTGSFIQCPGDVVV